MARKQFTEQDFVLKRVVPLLRRLGFKNVRYLHGTDEYGRDIVFYDTDRFGLQRLYAAQAKLGDISGSAGSVLNPIITQIDDAFRMPYYDPLAGEEKYIFGFYMVISGKYRRNAKEKIQVKCRGRGQPVSFLDGNDIDSIELEESTHELDMGIRELNRLRREAIASTRCQSPDFGLFELKLHEIDLLYECSAEERIGAFSEIGLEVTLNSDIGTDLLVEHLLFETVGWDSKTWVEESCGLQTGRRLLGQLAAVLWDFGLQAVEYGRGEKSIQKIVRAILEVAQKSVMIDAAEASRDCEAALGYMRQKAKRMKRQAIAALVGAALKEVRS